MDKIRIVIADDHDDFRNGLRDILKYDATLECLETASNGEEAVALVEKLQPDVLLLDIEMPVMDGIEVSRLVRQYSPNTAILVLSNYEYDHYLLACVQARVNGYLLKSVSAGSLTRAIHMVHEGITVFDPHCLYRLFDRVLKPSPHH